MDLSPGASGVWDTGNVTTMRGMFSGATAFVGTGASGGVEAWDTGKLEIAVEMFSGATNFNANIANWDISELREADNMLTGTAFSRTNYDALLVAWAAQAPSIQSGVTLNVDTPYTIATSQTARNILTGAPYNWNISDGGGI